MVFVVTVEYCCEGKDYNDRRELGWGGDFYRYEIKDDDAILLG